MVIMRPKKLKNGLQTDAQIKTWLTWSKKKSSKGNTVYCQCWSPRYKISLLSPKWQGCHPKGLTVTCSHETTNINHSKNNKNFHQLNFHMPVPILRFARQEKKSTETVYKVLIWIFMNQEHTNIGTVFLRLVF